MATEYHQKISPDYLPKLYSRTLQEKEGGWTRWVDEECSWEELDETFPEGDGSLVSQLAKIYRDAKDHILSLQSEIELLKNKYEK